VIGGRRGGGRGGRMGGVIEGRVRAGMYNRGGRWDFGLCICMICRIVGGYV